MTGLLWALETLAWDENYLVRVCIVLGELASRDPGGKWANRPANSLITILLPWHPQTTATISKREVAMQTLCKECPDVSWKLLINLLPNQFQTSMGSHKPVWHNTVPEDQSKRVDQHEYWEQVSFYASLAVETASEDIAKLCELIDHFDSLPKPSFDRLLEILSSENILNLSDEKRVPLWEKLIKFISTHRFFADAEWALDENLLTLIEEVANKLIPSNPLNRHRFLFGRDVDLYQGNGNSKELQKKISERRKKALMEIFRFGGLNAVVHFAESVQFPDQVGELLGEMADEKIDIALLPAYLEHEKNKHFLFISGYIWKRYYVNGWQWTDKLDKDSWNIDAIVEFLCCLPFTANTWTRATKWLGELESNYWYKVYVKPYQSDDDLAPAIDKLIEYGRPHAAINCLHTILYQNKTIDINKCVNALMAALSSSEPTNAMNGYYVVELIKLLQETPEVPEGDLWRVEWAYLQLLDHQAAPKALEKRLASNPEFFCEVIRLIYRSKKSTTIPKLNEKDRAIATNAWRLLNNWRTPPGTQENGSFSGEYFLCWLQRVKQLCAESGHLEVAFISVGKVLIYCPADSDGLWINHTVADALNTIDVDDMRRGFSTGIFNSRGVHVVDPTGKPERKLAEKYKRRAEEVENAGYQRFAVTLRSLSKSYERDAKRIIAEHKTEIEDNDKDK